MARGKRNTKDKRKNNHASNEGALLKNYKGFVIPHDKGFVIDRIDASTIDPVQFFETYVMPRKPCILLNLQPDTLKQWSNTYLKQKAGDQSIMVEQRHTEKSNFGREAPRIPMLFGDFLEKLEQGSNLYYLTSQTVNFESNELPDVVAPPLTALLDDMRLRLPIAGNLVPFQVNLWMGNVKNGTPSSSGLHHDFHDNIYMLLRGVKIFNIYSPSDAHLLSMTGKVTGIHENGMLIYKSHPFMTANGIPPIVYHEHLVELQSHLSNVETVLRRRISEIQQEQPSPLSSQSSSSNPSDDDDDAAAHPAIDDMLFLNDAETWKNPELSLDYLIRAEQRLREIIDYAIEEDLELEMKFNFAEDSDLAVDDDDDDDDSMFTTQLIRKKRRVPNGKTGDHSRDDIETDNTSEEAIFSHFSKVPPSSVYKTSPVLPPTTSQVVNALKPQQGAASESNETIHTTSSGFNAELYTAIYKHLQSMSTAQHAQHAPGREQSANPPSNPPPSGLGIDPDPFLGQIKQAKKATILLLPGESLFLPTGFFHEVRSLNLDFGKDPTPKQCGGTAAPDDDHAGHMAINFWFHPPSLQDHTVSGAFSEVDPFTNPYCNLFWQTYWQKHYQKYNDK